MKLQALIIGALLLFSNTIYAQYTTIPDSAFEQRLILAGIDTEGTHDSQILTVDAEAATGVNVSGAGINDMTGIEAFVNLSILYCQNNNISVLDVDELTTLTILHCYENNISVLNVTNLINLSNLVCDGNNISVLDVGALINLTVLSFVHNNISVIDLQGLNILTELWCGINNISVLDVSGLTSLTILSCFNNNISMLDVRSLPYLNTIFCPTNNLTSLDIRNGTNTIITSFNATDNPNLSCISVDDAGWSAANWTNIDPTTSFGEDVTGLPSVISSMWEVNLSWSTQAIPDACSSVSIVNDADIKVGFFVPFSAICKTLNVESGGELEVPVGSSLEVTAQ